MTAIDSLNRVRVSRVQYERLLTRCEFLEALSTRATPVLTGMPKAETPAIGRTDDPWAALADCKRACEAKLTKYLKDCTDLEKELECIHNVRIRTAMYYRYIDMRTVEEIADALSINERSAYRILRKGRLIYEQHYDRGEFNE